MLPFRPEAIVVQKYGGTSVGTPERIQAVAQRVAGHHRAGCRRIAVVVSAMSGETNRLVGLVEKVNPRATPRSYDVTVAAGEQISVGLVAAALEASGVEAEPFLGYQLGILTDAAHAKARIRSIDTDRIRAAWNEGRVPVIAGFQGMTETHAITTLGRGGSDTSAVALAVALKADVCEINTDVDGVYTADPRVVQAARHLDVLDYDTALELAALGSKVLHSRSVELGAKYRMPIVVRSSFDSDSSRRTLIMNFNDAQALEAPVVSGVTLDENVARVTVSGLAKESPMLSRIFSAIAQKGINVDIIVHDRDALDGKTSVGFTVARGDAEAAVWAIEEVKRETGSASLAVSTAADLAKVSAVGLGMRSHAGVASRVLDTLSGNGIDIVMISTSEIKISCVVPLADGRRATQALHAAFFPEVSGV